LTIPSEADRPQCQETSDRRSAGKESETVLPVCPFRGRILFVTPRGRISEHLAFSLRVECYDLRIVDSMSAALMAIDTESFDSLFIHESLQSQSGPLVDKLHRCQPTVGVRFYGTEADILINDTQDELALSLVRKDHFIIKHLDSRANGMFSLHATSVARVAEALCDKLHLPAPYRLAMFAAASFHNLAETGLTSDTPFAQKDIIALSAGRLESWGYHPLVVALLRDMYRDLTPAQKSKPNLPVIGASILSVVDFFYHAVPNPDNLRADCLCHLKECLAGQTASFTLPEIIDELIDVKSTEIRDRRADISLFDLHVLTSREALSSRLSEALATSGFTVTYSHTVDACAIRCVRTRPQVLLICNDGADQDIEKLILQIAFHGVPLDQIPTILFVDQRELLAAMRFITHGILDVIPTTADDNAVVAKLTRIKKDAEEKIGYRQSIIQELGTHGSLGDMNLVDLLEASRGNCRPLQISVSAEGHQLTVVTTNGVINFAECDNGKCGIEAIQQGIGWRRGIWNIDPIDSGAMPAPNVNKGIDSVLLEACVNYDSALRT